MSFLKRLTKTAGVAVVALTGVFALANTASADTVNFSTSGMFSAGSSSATIGSGGTSISANGYTLTFTPVFAGVFDPPSNTTLGLFQVSNNSAMPSGTFNGASFSLTINQTAPGTAGTGSSSATLQGTITSSTSSTLIVMTYSPNPVVIQSSAPSPAGTTFYTTSYTLRDTQIDPISSGGNADQRATVSQSQLFVPSPTAAMGGLVLLGGTALRRRRAA